MKWNVKRPDLLSVVVFLVIAVTEMIIMYNMAYKPEVITFWGPWPAWYVVCGWGFTLLGILVAGIIVYKCYDEEDFTVDEEDIAKEDIAKEAK